MDAVVLNNLSKSFGSVKANQNISLTVRKGEILALLGENGSGKSTLVNMLSGIYAPETGSICINGELKNFSSPQDAIKAGIGMVHQHFKLVEVMSAWENITLGERSAGFFINKNKIKNRINELVKQFGFDLDIDEKIYNMSVSEKQTVEIVKMLYHGANILVLDEPTAVLTPQETEKLFLVLRRMKSEGCSIVIITHKLSEVMSISDRVTVLRKGRLIGTVETSFSSEAELANMMLGGSVKLDIERAVASKGTTPILRVKNLCHKNKSGVERLKNMSFELFSGEILGVAGIVGSGQKELCEVLSGMLKSVQGRIFFEDKDILELNPLEIKKMGLRMNFVPEDRLGMGLVAGMDIVDNVMLRSYNEKSGFFVDRNVGRKKAEDIVDRYGIATPSIHNVVRELSGGNIQKVLLGREIEMKPKLLIASYPFRGLDVGATNNIISLLNDEKKKGVAILMIAEDIDQICALSDRVMILHDGEIMGIVNPEEVSREKIGLMMMGKKIEEKNV